MRRFPPFLLLAPLALVATTARAEAPVAEAPAAEAPAAEALVVAVAPAAAGESALALAPIADGAAPAPVVAAPAPAAPAAGSVAAAAVPVLAPAGSVDGTVDDKKEDKFPLHANAGLSNSLGNGVLAPGFQAQPNWATSLSLGGNAALPKVDFLPKMTLSTGVSFSVNNWLDAYSNSGVYSRQVRASDVNLGLGMPGAFTEDFTKIKVGLSFSGRLPTSITSRQQNLFTALGASVPVGWNSEEYSWGQIGVNYSLGGRVSLYTADAPTIPCEAGVSLDEVVRNPLENGDLPVAYGRVAELGANGECLLRGRQGIASISNNLGASWSLKGHSVSASLGYSVGFMRPLSTRPELSSEFASTQSFNESMNGNLSYSFEIPVDFPLSVSAGIGSGQGPYRSTDAVDTNGDGVPDQAGYELANPFYDFFTPANNYSAAFVELSIGI